MTELKPCPFCGGEVEHQLMFDGAYSFTCHSCGLNARFVDDIARAVPSAIDGTEMLWNTRYERTCQIEEWSDYGFDVVFYLSCGHSGTIGKDDLPLLYCYRCGAKVVE